MINNPNMPTQRFPSPNFPPPQRPQRNLWIWIAGAIAIVIIIGAFVIFALNSSSAPSTTSAQATATAATTATNVTPTATSATPAPASTPSSSGSTGGSTGGSTISLAQATATVNTYYADINDKYYQSAYGLWGSNYRSSTSYATFAQGFANTRRDLLQPGAASRLSDGTVKVPVTVTSNASTTVNTYQGYYIVGLEGGQVRLLNANLQFINSNPNVVQHAVSLIEQYYDDINAKDYSDAYSIWGAAYHKTTSYNQFAAGFASTKSDSITINYEGVMVLPNGSVQVPLTISAVNTSGSGTVAHTYHGYYIVDMENQVQHLLSANIQ